MWRNIESSPGAWAQWWRMSSELPNRAYYRAVEGAWHGPLDLTITDWRAFRGASIGLVDRLCLLAMVASARLFGPFRLDTSVAASGAEVVHTTRVSKWGMTMMRSRERLTLDDNNRDLTMAVALSRWPTLWRARVFPPVTATVGADGREASYRFPWFGTEMRQHGARSADGDTVTLTQETPFSRGVQVLRRR